MHLDIFSAMVEFMEHSRYNEFMEAVVLASIGTGSARVSKFATWASVVFWPALCTLMMFLCRIKQWRTWQSSRVSLDQKPQQTIEHLQEDGNIPFFFTWVLFQFTFLQQGFAF
jgi:hypothetical protein